MRNSVAPFRKKYQALFKLSSTSWQSVKISKLIDRLIGDIALFSSDIKKEIQCIDEKEIKIACLSVQDNIARYDEFRALLHHLKVVCPKQQLVRNIYANIMVLIKIFVALVICMLFIAFAYFTDTNATLYDQKSYYIFNTTKRTDTYVITAYSKYNKTLQGGGQEEAIGPFLREYSFFAYRYGFSNMTKLHESIGCNGTNYCFGNSVLASGIITLSCFLIFFIFVIAMSFCASTINDNFRPLMQQVIEAQKVFNELEATIDTFRAIGKLPIKTYSGSSYFICKNPSFIKFLKQRSLLQLV